MTIISQSYATLKKEVSQEFARKVLLENLRANKGNIKKTAENMKCSRNTVYLALKKEKTGNLSDKPHLPKTAHPKTTSSEIVNLVVKARKETGFGKRRLRWYLATQNNLLLPESTIGKILKVKKLVRKKQRVRRQYAKIKYQWDKILPFTQLEMDTKKIADKKTLPPKIYNYVVNSLFIPKWQWTIIDPVTRIRFLAWSYSRNWSCGQVFGKMVVWWLRMFGFREKIVVWSDGGTEFNAAQAGAFARTCQDFWKPLGIEREIIRK